MASTLTHGRSVLVTREELAKLPEPESLGPRHVPVPHIDLVDAIDRAATERGLAIRTERFALARSGAQMFGTFDYEKIGSGPDLKVSDKEGCVSLGFKAGNDRQVALQIAAGRRVFVCDNLCLSGDMIAMRRKHTTNLDLHEEVGQALDRYIEHSRRLDEQVGRLRTMKLDRADARALICEAFEQKVLPVTRFPSVIENYFEATNAMTDCLPRNRWGLHNAFTRAIKAMKPVAAFAATTKLGKFFGIGTEN